MARSLRTVASLRLVGVSAGGCACHSTGQLPTCELSGPNQNWDALRPVFDYLAETVIIH